MESREEVSVEEDPRTKRVKPGEFLSFKDDEGKTWLRYCSWCTPPTKAVRKRFPGAELTGSLCEKCEKKLDKQFKKIKRLEENG